MFIFYEFRPFLYRQRARYLSKYMVLTPVTDQTPAIQSQT